MPLSAEEKTIIHEKFQQLELDLELLKLAQDEDMKLAKQVATTL